MKSILDYPSVRLGCAIQTDPMIMQFFQAFNKIRCDEEVLLEQLIIEQSKIIRKLKQEIYELNVVSEAVFAHRYNNNMDKSTKQG